MSRLTSAATAFRIPQGQRGASRMAEQTGTLFRFSFWDGRLGGARASRVRVRASRPNHSLNHSVCETRVFGATPKTATGTVAFPITDGSRSPQFEIRNSKLSGLLFRFSFWVGRLGGARASRVRVRASRPNHWTHYLVLGTRFSARRRKRQPGRSRSPFQNRGSRCESAHYFAGGVWMERTDVRCYGSPQFAIRNSKWSGLLFRFSFWDGRLGGARASRVQVRASRPNHWTHYLVLGTRFSARRRKRQPGRSRSPLRTGCALAQFAIRNGQGFFSGFHFGMDAWGN